MQGTFKGCSPAEPAEARRGLIYPALHAPNRVDILANITLAEAFQKYVLNDPELRARIKHANSIERPEDEYFEGDGGLSFESGHCHGPHNEPVWPVAFEQHNLGKIIHPDPAKRSPVGFICEPSPPEDVAVADVFIDRFGALMAVLRAGDIEAEGHPVDPGHPKMILRTIWSSDAFFFDANTGHVFEVNSEAEDIPRDDWLKKRWVGVVLRRPAVLGVVEAPPVAAVLPFTAAEVVAIGSLAEALDRLAFNHPRVVLLRARASAAMKAIGQAFFDNAGYEEPVYGHDEPMLPLKAFRKHDYAPLTDEECRELAKTSSWPEVFQVPPQAHTDFRRELELRLNTLFGMLLRREVEGLCDDAGTFQRVLLLKTTWGREDLYILARTGDIYEAKAANGVGKMIKRWSGVVLQLPASIALSIGDHPGPKVKPAVAQDHLDVPRRRYNAVHKQTVAELKKLGLEGGPGSNTYAAIARKISTANPEKYRTEQDVGSLVQRIKRHYDRRKKNLLQEEQRRLQSGQAGSALEQKMRAELPARRR